MFFNNYIKQFILATVCFHILAISLHAQVKFITNKIGVDTGWAANSINTVVFRKNSLCTYNGFQYISFYNKDGFVVLGKRKLKSSKWNLQTTTFQANINDAHNSISIALDGEGFLHIAWGNHNTKLNYAKSLIPQSFLLSEKIGMTGLFENKVSYPEFYKMPNGNLIFMYRDGGSGKGNLVINSYDVKTKLWKQLQHNLIDGENIRNAYWQSCVDKNGVIHISWVWRETPDVASNHDMCYAKSLDGGITWVNSKNEKYQLPINAFNAEYIYRIPQKSELINQTSITVDDAGNPIIASYWKDSNDVAPQYHLLYLQQDKWIYCNTGFRKTNFSLSGMGTKRIPISRPQILAYTKNSKTYFLLIFRDEERGNKISIAQANKSNLNSWQILDVMNEELGSWEPTYDIDLWAYKKQLNLFVQHTEQVDGEGKVNFAPQMVHVLDVKIK